MDFNYPCPNVKLEPIGDDVIVLSVSIEEVYAILYLFDTSPFRSSTRTPSKVPIDVDNTPSNLFYMGLACLGTPSQHPHWSSLSPSSTLNIVDAIQ